MYCHGCGKAIETDSRFCTFCGAVLNVKAQQNFNTDYITQQNNKRLATKENRCRKTAKFFIVLAIIVRIISLVSHLQNIFLVPLRESFPFASVGYVIGFFPSIVLFAYFLLRKKCGYTKSLKIILGVNLVISDVASFLTVFFEPSYVFADSTTITKTIIFVAVIFLSNIFFLFMGSVLEKPWEKIAAVFGFVSCATELFVIFMVYYNMKLNSLPALFLNFILGLPFLISLFIYPVLSKPLKKEKNR